MKKLISLVAALLCVLACVFGLVACGNGSGDGDNTVAVTKVTLNKSSLELVVGDEETLTATVSPDDATDKSVKWSSDNKAVATVENGKVKGESVGTAKITATAGGKKAECTVKVSAPAAKLTEDEWGSCIAAFVNGENFSLKREVNDVIVAAMQLEGTTYYELADGDKSIFVKDSNLYYCYKLDKDDETWSKNISSASNYYRHVFYAQGLVEGAATVIAGSYSSFTYAGGKYTAAAIHIDDEFDLKDVEITVSGTSLKKVICTWVGVDGEPDELVTVYNIGTTDIKLPETFTDNASMQYYQVSDYQWIDALQSIIFENVTATLTYNKEVYLFKTDINEKGAYYFKDSDNTEYCYYYSENTIYSFVKENEDKLFTRRVEKSKANFGDFIEDFVSLEPFAVINLGKSYAKFEFNSESKTYIGTDIDILGEIWDVELKFENKKLSSANFTSLTDTITVTYSDYNSTVVDVPENYVDGSAQGGQLLDIDKLKEIAEKAEDKHYTKVVITQDDESETYYYGTEDWEDATQGIHLTASDLDDLSDGATILSITEKADAYELVFKVDQPIGYVIQTMVLDEDFYVLNIEIEFYTDDDELALTIEISYEWGYGEGPQDGEISLEELLELAAKAEDRHYTKVVITNDDGKTINSETYYYGTEDWDKATEGMPLTAESLQNLATAGTLLSSNVRGDNYELIFKINISGGYVIQELILNADFYPLEISAGFYNEEGEEIRISVAHYKWG